MSLGDLGYIVLHASGKQLMEEQIAEVQYYAKGLKYPLALWFTGKMTKMITYTACWTTKRLMFAGK
jgi:hypothetical protein